MAAPTARQTSVADAAVSFPGLIADARSCEVDSRFSEESATNIPFGVMVVRGTDEDNGVLLPHTNAATAAPICAGVVVHGHDFSIDTELATDGLKPGVSFRVLRKGRVWVQVEEAVNPGDAVRFRAAAAGQKGAFLKTASAGNTVNISKFAQWMSTVTAAGEALLEIDMVGQADATAD